VPLSNELGGKHGEETKENGEGRKKGREKNYTQKKRWWRFVAVPV
jgi:hypothetical protein